MIKTAGEYVKLAHLTGNAVAMLQYGFDPSVVSTYLMEKGASAEDAYVIVKEAAGLFGAIGRGLMTLGTKAMPAIAKGVGALGTRGAGAAARGAQLSLPGMGGAAAKAGTGLGGALKGWATGAAGRAGQAFTAAGKGMQTNPWQTLGGGLKGFGQGAMFGQGQGIGATLGKGTLGYSVGSSMFGG